MIPKSARVLTPHRQHCSRALPLRRLRLSTTERVAHVRTNMAVAMVGPAVVMGIVRASAVFLLWAPTASPSSSGWPLWPRRVAVNRLPLHRQHHSPFEWQMDGVQIGRVHLQPLPRHLIRRPLCRGPLVVGAAAMAMGKQRLGARLAVLISVSGVTNPTLRSLVRIALARLIAAKGTHHRYQSRQLPSGTLPFR